MVDALFPSAIPADRTWHRYSTTQPLSGEGNDVVVYGVEVPTEAELKLLGPVEGARVLDLGCGTGRNAVALALSGAKVMAVDPSAEALGRARERCDAAEVRVELHQAGLAELAFLRSDSIDAAISVMALAPVDDLARVFRQVHRVLKPEAPLVCSFPHPAFAMFDPRASDPLRVVRAYDDPATVRWEQGPNDIEDHPRTFSDIFTTLQRANFRMDQVIEPTATASGSRDPGFADLMRTVPATLVVRARKQGN